MGTQEHKPLAFSHSLFCNSHRSSHLTPCLVTKHPFIGHPLWQINYVLNSDKLRAITVPTPSSVLCCFSRGLCVLPTLFFPPRPVSVEQTENSMPDQSIVSVEQQSWVTAVPSPQYFFIAKKPIYKVPELHRLYKTYCKENHLWHWIGAPDGIPIPGRGQGHISVGLGASLPEEVSVQSATAWTYSREIPRTDILSVHWVQGSLPHCQTLSTWKLRIACELHVHLLASCTWSSQCGDSLRILAVLAELAERD